MAPQPPFWRHVTDVRTTTVARSDRAMGEISPYLYGYAMRAARHFGHQTQASITFRHHGAVVRAASSDDRSARCDQVEASVDDGPCLVAMTRLHPVVVDDLGKDSRWTDWRRRASAEGFASALAMPSHVAPGMDMALNLYSPVAHRWDTLAVDDAEAYAETIAHAIGLRVHLSTVEAPRPGLDLAGWEIVEQAVGATMQCNGCTRDQALGILLGAAGHRKVGLEEVAATVLLALTGVHTGDRAPVRGHAPAGDRGTTAGGGDRTGLDIYAERAADRLGPHVHCSLTVSDGGALKQVASTDPRAAACDRIETAQKDGPCILAMEQLSSVVVDDIANDPRWPQWRQQALDSGFRSFVALPAYVDDDRTVAVNVYSETLASWTRGQILAVDAYVHEIAGEVAAGRR